MRIIVLIAINIGLNNFLYSQNTEVIDSQCFRLNFSKKDTIPKLFAEGIISTKFAEFGITISPDLCEIYFTRRGANENPRLGEIMVMKKIANNWTEPYIASFSGKYNDMEPLLTPDGAMLLFGSNRPVNKGDKPGQYNQWFVEKTDTGWNNPKLFSPLCNRGFVMYPTMANNKNIYYTSIDGIYKLSYNDGKYNNPEKLPDLINKLPRAAHPYICPDESYIIFDAQTRGEMKSDLFISYNENGSWSEPKKLSKEINASESNAIAFITFDGELFFFVRNGDIYWTQLNFIKEN